MMTLAFAFWMYVALFAFIGAMRGWARELMVTFGLIVGLFIIAVMERFAPGSLRAFLLGTDSIQFWIRSLIVVFLVIFGYQTPNIPKIPQGRFARERLSDALLGLFLGALNGYLIVGTIWFFMEQSNYPLAPFITKPTTEMAILNYLPPNWLIAANSPLIYFAVALAFLFVIIVFV